ncbi:MAG: hypothetical protein Q8O94_03110 [bacterium]|nr:hypothetical protein [bacterium]
MTQIDSKKPNVREVKISSDVGYTVVGYVYPPATIAYFFGIGDEAEENAALFVAARKDFVVTETEDRR